MPYFYINQLNKIKQNKIMKTTNKTNCNKCGKKFFTKRRIKTGVLLFYKINKLKSWQQ